MSIPYVFNIQKYCLHDGDGIRTTVFFKGCAMNCWWCHNPESQNFMPELLMNYERCTGCMSCANHCPEHAISLSEDSHVAITDLSKCVRCWECTDFCINNNRDVAGKQYSIKELMKIIDKDSQFYEESGGGVTLSGGEVMAQSIDYLTELAAAIKNKGYNLTVDTCGFAPRENFEKLAPYVDTFLYDVKCIDNEKHMKYMGQSNELVLENLRYLSSLGKNIYIRIPMVEQVNCDDAEMGLIIDFLKGNKINVKRVNLLPYHNTGSSKYEKLGLEYKAKDFSAPSEERQNELVKMFNENGFFDVKIGG